MKENFEKACMFTLTHEGYKSGDVFGGRTIFGIAERYFPDIVRKLWDLPRDQAEKGAMDFYRANVWENIGCDGLPWPLDAVAFDSAVNPGPSFVLTTLKVTKDFKSVLLKRIRYYLDRVKENPEKKEFLEGWLNRVFDLEDFCYKGGE